MSSAKRIAEKIRETAHVLDDHPAATACRMLCEAIREVSPSDGYYDEEHEGIQELACVLLAIALRVRP
jgi:hypothetical protein